MVGEYRIVRTQYFNEKAVVSHEKLIVQRLSKTMFGEMWKPLEHYFYIECKKETEFDSIEEAREFIERLKAGTPRCQRVNTTLETA